MSILSSIGKIYGNVFKGAASMMGFDTSGFENDEAEKFQAQQAQMNRDWQDAMMSKQMEWTEKMWNKSNEYNSAKAQVQRYREAGLNPYLMMTGGASAGVATSQGAPSGMSAPSPTGGFANTHKGDISQVINSITNKRMAESEIRAKNADSSLKEIEAETARARWQVMLENLRRDGRYKDIVNEFEPLQRQAHLDSAAQALLNQKEERRALEISNAIQSKELANYDYVFKLKCAQLIADIREKKASEGLKLEQAQHEFFKGLETIAKEQGINLDNKKKRAIFDAEVEKAIQDTMSPIGRYNNGTSNWIGSREYGKYPY